MSSMGPLLDPGPGDADAMLAGIASKRRRRRNRRIALSALVFVGLLLLWVRWAGAPETLDARGFEQVAVVPGHGGELKGPDGFRLVLPDQGLEEPIEVRWTTVRTPEELASVPGQLATVIEGNTTPLQSFGMVQVELEVAGAPHALVGQARIEVPLHQAHPFGQGDAVALYHLDEDEGIWTLEGEGAVADGRFVAEVAHFSWWNAAAPTTLAGCLCGTVEGGEAGVVVLGQEHLVRARTKTVDGRFCVEMLAHEPVEVLAYGDGESCRSVRTTAVVGEPREPYPGLGCSEVALQLQTCTDEAPLPTAPEPVDIVRLYVMSEQTEGRAVCGSEVLPFTVEWSVAGFVAPLGRTCSIELGGRQIATYPPKQGVHRLYCDDTHCSAHPLAARVEQPPQPLEPEQLSPPADGERRTVPFVISNTLAVVPAGLDACSEGRGIGPLYYRVWALPDGSLGQVELDEGSASLASEPEQACFRAFVSRARVKEPPRVPARTTLGVGLGAANPSQANIAGGDAPARLQLDLPPSSLSRCVGSRDLGPLRYWMTVHPNGEVSDVHSAASTRMLDGEPEDRCLRALLASWTVPSPPTEPTLTWINLRLRGERTASSSVSYEVLDVMLRNDEGVKKCFWEHRQVTGVLPSRVDVRFRLESDGSAGPVSVEQRSLADTALPGCLDRAIRAIAFPPTSGSGQEISYPLVLQGQAASDPRNDGQGVSDELVRLYITNSMRVQACIDDVFAAEGAIPNHLEAELRIAPDGTTRLLGIRVSGASTPDLQTCLGEAFATIRYPERPVETRTTHAFTQGEPERPKPAPAPVFVVRPAPPNPQPAPAPEPVPVEPQPAPAPAPAPAPELRVVSTGLIGRIRSDRAVQACLTAARASEGVLVEVRLAEGDDRAGFSVVDDVPDALKTCLTEAVGRLRFDDGPRYEVFLLEL